MSEPNPIQVASPEGAGLIAAVALVYLTVRLLPRWMAAGSERVSAVELRRRMNSETPPLVLDVRGAAEVAETGLIPGSLHVPLAQLSSWLREQQPALDRERPAVALCRSDARAALAARALRRAGFRSTGLLAGGVEAWSDAGFPLREPDRQETRG